MRIRFSLKWLLIFVVFAALLMGYATQYGLARGRVKITQMGLVQDESGRVSGKLLWLFYDPDRQVHRYVVGSFSNMERPDLLELNTEDLHKFRYRAWSFGPFKRQPPSEIFLTRFLEIPKEQITGYLTYELLDEVVIDGSR